MPDSSQGPTTEKIELMEEERRLVSREWEVGDRNKEVLVKDHNLPIIRRKSSEDLTCNMLATVNTALFT
jgi:hypothetical protein